MKKKWVFWNNCKDTYKSIEDLKIKKIVTESNRKSLRRQTEILVIDDQGFDIKPILENHGYNIEWRKDINNIVDAQGYDIILCDIKGVGKNFGSEFEGAHLIKELRLTYRYKYIIAYTGSSCDPTYNYYLDFADKVVTKGNSSTQWVEELDLGLERFFDVTYQWKKLRIELLGQSIPIGKVAQLESELVSSIENKNFENFNKLVEENKDNVGIMELIKPFLSSTFIKLLIEDGNNG